MTCLLPEAYSILLRPEREDSLSWILYVEDPDITNFKKWLFVDICGVVKTSDHPVSTTLNKI